MTSETFHRCAKCRGALMVDVVAMEYRCARCGAVFAVGPDGPGKCREIMDGGRKQMVSARGTCVVCDREDISIVGRGACSACYTMLVAHKGDVAATKAWRAEHPIRGRHAKDGDGTDVPGNQGPDKSAPDNEPIISGMPPVGAVENQRRRVVIDLDIVVNIQRFSVVVAGKELALAGEEA